MKKGLLRYLALSVLLLICVGLSGCGTIEINYMTNKEEANAYLPYISLFFGVAFLLFSIIAVKYRNHEIAGLSLLGGIASILIIIMPIIPRIIGIIIMACFGVIFLLLGIKYWNKNAFVRATIFFAGGVTNIILLIMELF